MQDFDEEEELDLDSIDDEQTLIELLDETEDIDERKRIRDRLKKVQFEIKAQREKDRLRREDAREQKLREKVRAADLHKQQTLAMYDQMAKQGTHAARKGSATGSSPGADNKPRDLVEETIQDRLRRADERKQRLMAAYDHASKTQPSGGARIVEFDTFHNADVSKLEPAKPARGSCTFGMSGGIAKVEKATPASSPRPAQDESGLDSMERAIRARVREADERKRRTLAAYDMVARSGGAGPKVVILEEFKNLDVNPDIKKPPKYDPCFRGGLKT